MKVTLPLANVKVINETIDAINNDYRIIVHQGGTRSGKTFSIVQLLIYISYTNKKPLQTSVVSVSMPHLRRGAMRDWQYQMNKIGLYNENAHQKTTQTYNYPTGSYIEFFSVDDSTKVRGPGRDILFINECNLIDRDTFLQLLLRTKKIVIIDYNPADEFHWIYDDVIPRNDCKFIKSTYKDNPFITKQQLHEIENLKNIGGNYWKVYGLGERGQRRGLIYPKHTTGTFKNVDKLHGYGLDFGFSSDPTALIEVGIEKDQAYCKELIYETGLTNQDLIRRFHELNINTHTLIVADSAEPQRIEEIRRAGYNIRSVQKGPDSIRTGIDAVSRYNLIIDKESINLQKEVKSYSWQIDANDKILAKPVPYNDHLMDALRYIVVTLTKDIQRIGKARMFS